MGRLLSFSFSFQATILSIDVEAEHYASSANATTGSCPEPGAILARTRYGGTRADAMFGYRAFRRLCTNWGRPAHTNRPRFRAAPSYRSSLGGSFRSFFMRHLCQALDLLHIKSQPFRYAAAVFKIGFVENGRLAQLDPLLGIAQMCGDIANQVSRSSSVITLR